jgi:ABC-type glycerol-3-phosphate transport system substrate-binding protein
MTNLLPSKKQDLKPAKNNIPKTWDDMRAALKTAEPDQAKLYALFLQRQQEAAARGCCG